MFLLYEKAPLYKSLRLCLFGILEICGGVLMFGVHILSEYSINVIQNGLNNIDKGIEMKFNGKDFKGLKVFGILRKKVFCRKYV